MEQRKYKVVGYNEKSGGITDEGGNILPFRKYWLEYHDMSTLTSHRPVASPTV